MIGYLRRTYDPPDLYWRIVSAMGGEDTLFCWRHMSFACWLLAAGTDERMANLVKLVRISKKRLFRELVEWYQHEWVSGNATREELGVMNAVVGVPALLIRVVPRGTWQRPTLFVPNRTAGGGRCNVPGCVMPADGGLGVCGYHATMWTDSRLYEQQQGLTVEIAI